MRVIVDLDLEPEADPETVAELIFEILVTLDIPGVFSVNGWDT